MVVRAGWLAQVYGGEGPGRVCSVHHQAVKRLGNDLVVEAVSADDDIVEAVRYVPPAGAPARFVYGVQWHPEFHDPDAASLLSPQRLLAAFLDEARAKLSTGASSNAQTPSSTHSSTPSSI